MKKLITLFFAIGLVTASFAQGGDRQRNESRRDDNGYQSAPYSNNDQYRSSDQYRGDERYSGYDRRDHDRFERDRQRASRQRYEMEMRRNARRYHDQRRHDDYPYGYSRQPGVHVSIGIGGVIRL